MPTDANLALQASVTKTAAFNGTALTLGAGAGTGTPRRGIKVRVIYSAASVSSATGTAIFGVAISYDGGSTFTDLFFSTTVALSTTAASGEIFIPFEVSPTSVANGIQIRPDLTTITGTGATVTYQMDVVIARP